MTTLHVISAGAAKGLVLTLAARFEALHGTTVRGTFGAVGAMRETLLGGAPCDVVVLTQALLAALASDGEVVTDTLRTLGEVATGVAVRTGDAIADIHDAASLREALSHATSIHIPDPARATAGIHFTKVLDSLNLYEAVATHLRPHANGAAAMAALAESGDERPIGCTQVSEILYTPGVRLVAPLPSRFALVTRYDAAVASRACESSLAEAFVASLTGEATRSLRAAGGFREESHANRVA